jgi:hypothetical protein
MLRNEERRIPTTLIPNLNFEISSLKPAVHQFDLQIAKGEASFWIPVWVDKVGDLRCAVSSLKS